MIAVHPSDGLSWVCLDCGVDWPGPSRERASRFACPHCGEWCKYEVWGLAGVQIDWRPPVCSVPWNACPICSRPWEYFEDERFCFACHIGHQGGRGDSCAEPAAAVVLLDGARGAETRTYCACHTEVALREIPGSRRHVDLTLYVLPTLDRASA